MEKCHCGYCEKCLRTTEKTLMERAEEARQAGKRDLFLKLKAQAEAEAQTALQKRHEEALDRAIRDFPEGLWIPELHATIQKMENGCGTQEGWIRLMLNNDNRGYAPRELRAKIRKAKEAGLISKAFNALKFSASERVRLPAEYGEAIDGLLSYMELDCITSLDDVLENSLDGYGQSYQYALKSAMEAGYTDEEAEEQGQEAESEARDSDFVDYQEKVYQAIRYVLLFADLNLIEGKAGKWYISPRDSWQKSADKVAEIITGYGTFEYKDGKTLKEIGPYKTYAEAVVKHLHWLKKAIEVYGGRSYDSIFK